MKNQQIIMSLCLVLAFSIIAPALSLRGAAEPFQPYGRPAQQQPRTTVKPSWLMAPAQASLLNSNWWQQGSLIFPQRFCTRSYWHARRYFP